MNKLAFYQGYMTKEAESFEKMDPIIKNVVDTLGGGDDAYKLMHGTAATESNYGGHKNTYRPGYHGGVFQVDKIGFQDTQNLKSHPGLAKKYALIKKKFGIDWNKVKWKDLRNPLHSTIAARLYYMNKPSAIPKSRVDRAKYWKTNYNTGAGKGTWQKYLKRSKPGFSQATPQIQAPTNMQPQTAVT